MSDQLKEFDVFNCDLTGRHLIEASAGTGKTYTITSIYIRLLLETDLLPSDILVVTFTDAATAELKQRIRSRVQESVKAISESKAGKEDEFLIELVKRYGKDAAVTLKDKLDKFDEASIYTIHGFCNRLLTEFNILFDVPADFELLTDDRELLQDATDQFWREFVNTDLSKTKEALLDQLVNQKIGPDKIQSILKKIFSRPYAKVVPSPLDLNKFEKQVNKLKELFAELKSVYSNEKEDLYDFFFGDALSGTKYKSNKKKEYYAYFEHWVGQEHPSISYFEQLDKFGSKMPAGIKKNETAPDLAIFELVDRFIEQSDSLRSAIFQFISMSSERTKDILSQRKEKAGLLTYDDLLFKVWKGIDGKESERLRNLIVSKYPVALVDEFQDTDPIQYGIFDSVYKSVNSSCLFMIGDPKQSIYGFRGADIYTYVEARNSLKENSLYGLNYNYRSNKGLLESINELFTFRSKPFLLDSLNYQNVFAPSASAASGFFQSNKPAHEMSVVRVRGHQKMNKGDAASEVSDAVIKLIINLLDEDSGYKIGDERVSEKDIAVLVRDRYQGQLVQDRLRKAGIFSVLRSKDSVYESSEAKDLLIILTALSDMQYDPFVKAALTTDLIGMNFDEISDLWENSGSWNKIYQDLIEIKQVWFKSGISGALQKLENLFSIQKVLGRSIHAHRKITNYRHLKELLLRMEKEGSLDPDALLKSFSNKINDPENFEGEEIRLENDEDLIQILTIHSSKGLEFPIVLNPFLWTAEKTPNNGTGIVYVHKEGQKLLDIRKKDISEGRKENELIAFRNSISESLRLMYVALTRAKNACYLFLPDHPDIYLSPLGVIVQDPEQLEIDLANKVSDGRSKKGNIEETTKVYGELFHTIDADTLHSRSVKRKSNTKKKIHNAQTLKRGDISIKKKVISYSWLSRQSDNDHWYSEDDPVSIVNSQSKAKNIGLTPFTFPKGANAGSFLHDIFENADFRNLSGIENLIKEKLQQYGFDQKWQNPVKDWVEICLNTNLNADGLKLSSLSAKDVSKEMEFHFPIVNMDLNEINKMMQYNELQLNAELVSGHLKGFIDLIFRWNGRFYIADYKSNYLGDSFEDYSTDSLENSMHSSQYDLQYYVYAMALNKYLRSRIVDYDYDKHFGGVFYLYLRGLNKGGNQGIYFDRPELKKIQELYGTLTK